MLSDAPDTVEWMACGVTLIKSFSYRGNAEEWSNQYWFTGATPADGAAWKTLIDALIAQEKTLYVAGHVVVRAYGYASDAPHAVSVYSYDYAANAATVPGTALPGGTGVYSPGDSAAWVRWNTSRRNTHGKLIYLRKYFHGVPLLSGSGGASDAVVATWRTAALAFGLKMRDGTFQDARTLTAAGHTDVLTGHSASLWMTTRTLKRRGKRPPT